MNRLPKVLQTEIFEYVRGDRAFFKQQFQIVMTELSFHSPRRHFRQAKMLKDPSLFSGENITCGSPRSGHMTVSLQKRGKRHSLRWQVVITNYTSPQISSVCPKNYHRFEDARAEFRRQVVIAATKTAGLWGQEHP
jgi:hypothetical protein